MRIVQSRRRWGSVTSDDCTLIVYALGSGRYASRHIEYSEGTVRRPHVTMCYGIGI